MGETVTKTRRTDYLIFEHTGKSASGKTDCWAVVSVNHGNSLGGISWYGQWRQYSFFPAAMTVFNRECLRDIAQFIEDVMREKNKK